VTQAVVPEGTALGEAQAEGLIIQTTVPAGLRPVGAVARVDPQNADLIVLSDLPAGQTVLEAGVGTATAVTGPLDIPNGQMAVSVLLEDPAKVGAFLRPGSRVAIFDTSTVTTGGGGGTQILRTRPLLDDVTVLAVGSVARSGADDAAQEAWEAQLVTLAVTQEQAERVVHASRTGALHFALLGEGALITESEGVSDLTLFEPSSPDASEAASPGAVSVSGAVEVS
jgi:pilus assembly protein CpaB